MSEDIFEMFMHKNHGDFQKLSVIVKDSKSQVQNYKVLKVWQLQDLNLRFSCEP